MKWIYADVNMSVVGNGARVLLTHERVGSDGMETHPDQWMEEVVL